MDFIKSQFPLNDLQEFEQFYPLYTIDKKYISPSLFTKEQHPQTIIQLEHSFISQHFPTLIIREDIIRMHEIICELFLLPHNATKLGIENIHNYTQDDSSSSVLIFSSLLEPVNA